jgi:hypothetical protein
MDTPLSRSSVSLKLEEIQRRCTDLMESPGSELELAPEEVSAEIDSSDPYNRQRPLSNSTKGVEVRSGLGVIDRPRLRVQMQLS